MPRPLFIAALGNPSPYLRTLHSAGTFLLDPVRFALALPSFSRHTSTSGALTLYRSPATMNVSGPGVARAYKDFLRGLDPPARAAARLVVLHDELELPLGRLKLRRGGSARGHNGLKSVAASFGTADFVRIGVGIGRPESRDRGDVSNYVLRRMAPHEEESIKGAAGEVVALLEQLAAEEEG